jgi:hypothetical protein
MLPATLAAIHSTTFAGITPEQVALLTSAQIKVLGSVDIST